MRIAFLVAVLFLVAVVSADRYYYFQTLSSPEFVPAKNKLEEPDRSTRTVIFSIDTPLFREDYLDQDEIEDLKTYQRQPVPPIGWAGPIPDFQTDETIMNNSGYVTASVAMILATIALLA